jgi:hypothetical protein
MGRAHSAALAAAGAFGLATAMMAAQAPGQQGAGQKPPTVQNPPPASADPSPA